MTKAEIQFIRSLADKRVRDAEHLFIAEGAKLVEEIRDSKFRIRRIYTTHPDIKGENFATKDLDRYTCCCGATLSPPRHRS